jgi:hypothetical protein
VAEQLVRLEQNLTETVVALTSALRVVRDLKKKLV